MPKLSAQRSVAKARALSRFFSKRFGAKQFPQEARQEVIDKLLFTPEREALWNRAGTRLEQDIKGGVTDRAYLHGSFTSEKPKPSDVDVIAEWDLPVTMHLKGEGDPLDVLHVPKDYDPMRLGKLISEGKERYGEHYDLIRILGLTGALGLGASTMAPDEAEAARWPLEVGKLVKKIRPKTSSTGVISSAIERLKGQQIGERTIENVFKEKGNWRRIVYNDGTEQLVDSAVIRELAAETGTRQYVGGLVDLSPAKQLERARKSLEFHRNRDRPRFKSGERGQPWLGKEHKEQFRKMHERYVETAGGGPPIPYIWVESERLYLPEEYARILERAGDVKIKVRK